MSEQSDRRRRRLTIWLAGSSAFVVLSSVVFGSALSNAELYFPLDPAIDTVFSARYSEARFDALRPGMTAQDVEERLGRPFSWSPVNAAAEHVPPRSTFVMGFSHDGACTWGDFAWLGRYVYFDDARRVTGTAKGINYD